MCALLYRLRYPNRLVDLIDKFHRSKFELSLILTEIVDDIYQRFNVLFTDLPLDIDVLQHFVNAIASRDVPIDSCFGFIDGTVRPICRPIDGQRLFYNGHKRVHALKFQSVSFPNGLIGHLFGPIEGRRHDAYLLAESGLMHRLAALPRRQEDGRPYTLYGDPAYPISPHLICPYRGAVLTDEQQEFNRTMSSARQSVEWCFGKIATNFSFLDFKKDLKILLQPVAKYYVVGALITNCHTCLYGSQTSRYFQCQPPSLESYLAGRMM